MQQAEPFCAFAISAVGSAQSLEKYPDDDAASESAYVWVHLHLQQKGARQWLEDDARLKLNVVKALTAADTRPRALVKDNGTMIILRAMNLKKGQDPEDMFSLRMWIDERRVITICHRDIKAIEELKVSMEQGEPPLSPAEFLISVTSRLFARMEPFLDELEDSIAQAEERMVCGAESQVADGMFTIRKRVAIFRRYITPQKSVLIKLHDDSIPWLKPEHQQHLGEELDRVTLYVEELEELANRTQILNEELRNVHAEKLNNLAYVFSVVATIFLPLGFLTGLLGVNVGGMPGLEHPYAFWVFTSMCVGLAFVMIALFKRLKWYWE